MTITVEFLPQGDRDYIAKLNAMRAQTNAELDSTRSYADNQVATVSAKAVEAQTYAAQTAASALSAASVVQQDLSAIDRTFFTSTTLVDVCLYDTSKDSDGGAWRKRCAHTSWENETLSGNWLGSAANEAAARAINGATTNSYYYDTTAAVFYKLNAGSGVTQVYRGNARQFPAQVLITAESGRVIIWDITQAGCPMWMVFVGVVSGTAHSMVYVDSVNYPATGVALRDGVLVVSVTLGARGGVTAVNFVSDGAYRLNSSTSDAYAGLFPQKIASRNSACQSVRNGLGALAIVNANANDVAISVLPNAPIDIATGLPVPTIAVATDGGASVIQHDGTVSTKTESGTVAKAVGFDGQGGVWVGYLHKAAVIGLRAYSYDSPAIATATARTYGGAGTPYLAITPTAGSNTSEKVGLISKKGRAFGFGDGAVNGLALLEQNRTAQASGLVAYLTKDYNSGWLPGDIRGAWLADTVIETITGNELVTNGTFATDASGWSALAGAALSVASAELTVTNSGATNGGATQVITTVVGKTYTAACTARVGTATPVNLKVGTTSGAADLGSASTTSASNITLAVTFTATGTTTYLSLINDADSGGTGIYDSVSCRIADTDRSVKAKGMQVFGSLTKAAVASGAQLVGYSGWSASNYLEQPFNSDMDLGTGDFCVMGWLITGSNISSSQYLFSKADADGTPRCYVSLSGGKLFLTTFDSAGSFSERDSAAAVSANSLYFFAALRTGGTLNFYVSGALSNGSGTTPTTGRDISSVSGAATAIIGCSYAKANPFLGTLALLRVAAYAPSADQIKFIYETEKALFEANAQCCLAGTSNAITALTYDDEADLLHVGTSWGRSAFKGLVRVDSEATPVGAIRALAAGAGIVAQAGASGADVYVPAYLLREELLRDAEQAAKFGAPLVAHDFDATASQTTFTLPVGWEIVAVYAQGSIKREGAAKDWTRTFDGFKWSVVFASGRSASDWISILARRTS